MFAQTISLFRYLLLGILSKRLLILVAILSLVAVLVGSFFSELAIINGDAIVVALIADFLRYSLALLVLLLVATYAPRATLRIRPTAASITMRLLFP